MAEQRGIKQYLNKNIHMKFVATLAGKHWQRVENLQLIHRVHSNFVNKKNSF